MYGRWPVAAADHAANDNHHDVAQEMAAVPQMTRIRHRFKVRTDRLNIDQSFRHWQASQAMTTQPAAPFRRRFQRTGRSHRYNTYRNIAPACASYPSMRAGLATRSRPVRRANRTGVRASIGALKPGNAGGAKGRRELDEMRDGQQRLTTEVPTGDCARRGYPGRTRSSTRDSIARLCPTNSHADDPYLDERPRVFVELWPCPFASPLFRPVSPVSGKPTPGEPCAGDPHARFGGEGDRGNNRSSLPYRGLDQNSALIVLGDA